MGADIPQVHVHHGKGEQYKVDLFSCTPENWGNTLLIRTGSAEFSQWMVTGRNNGGALPDGYGHVGGRLHQGGHIIPLYEEQDWFDICGLPFVPPAERVKFGLATSPSYSLTPPSPSM